MFQSNLAKHNNTQMLFMTPTLQPVAAWFIQAFWPATHAAVRLSQSESCKLSWCVRQVRLSRSSLKVKATGQSWRSQEENKGLTTAEMADRGWKTDLNWKLQ